jgi:hypothetical protein
MNLQERKVQIVLAASDDGQEQVLVRIDGCEEPMLALTPCQARTLATELITAVNRAEVKASLKVSSNLSRRPGDPLPRLASAR